MRQHRRAPLRLSDLRQSARRRHPQPVRSGEHGGEVKYNFSGWVGLMIFVSILWAYQRFHRTEWTEAHYEPY